MNDKIGKRPDIKSKEQALKVIRTLALDKRGHVMTEDHCSWLELKLKEVALIAFRGLKCNG